MCSNIKLLAASSSSCKSKIYTARRQPRAYACQEHASLYIRGGQVSLTRATRANGQYISLNKLLHFVNSVGFRDDVCLPRSAQAKLSPVLLV